MTTFRLEPPAEPGMPVILACQSHSFVPGSPMPSAPSAVFMPKELSQLMNWRHGTY